MNYRRGLQRFYAVLAFCWVAFILIAIPSGQFEISPLDDYRRAVEQTGAPNWDDIAKESGGTISSSAPKQATTLKQQDWFDANAPGAKASIRALPIDLAKNIPTFDEFVSSRAPQIAAPTELKTRVEKPAYAVLDTRRHDRAARDYTVAAWSWAVGLATIPTALVYLLLFVVAPWVYRGFRSGTHI